MTDGKAMARIEYRPTEISTEQLGAIFVKSGFFKDTRDQAQAIVKILAGRELGFGPIASMQGVYLVNGRVTLAANFVAAAIQRSGKYRYRVAELTNERCHIIFSDAAGVVVGESTFTIEDAKLAGLASENYKKFPRNMLFSRALTNGARWYTPEVFNGPVYTPDEVGGVVDDEGHMLEGGALPVEVAERAYVPTGEREVDDADIIRSEDDPLWGRWLKVLSKAHDLGVRVKDIRLPMSRQDLRAYGSEVMVEIKKREQQLATQDQETAALA